MFEFTSPWIFLALPLPWLARRLIPAATPFRNAALKIPFFQRIKQIKNVNMTLFTAKKTQFYVVFSIWALLILAAMGPRWLGTPVNLPQSGRDIMLAVDVSGSMQTLDMELNGKPVERLTAVQTVAGDFIQQRVGDRLGLILFGSKAYIQTPLTFDRDTVHAMLMDATIGLAGSETAIGDAIGLAVKHLQTSPVTNRALILLTDGANNMGSVTPEAAAEWAAQQNIRIYTIGIGGGSTLANPNWFNPQMLMAASQLDIPMLQSIAKITGGLCFLAKDSAKLQEIYQMLNELEPIISNSAVYRPITELYPWPLTIALILSIFIIWNKL